MPTNRSPGDGSITTPPEAPSLDGGESSSVLPSPTSAGASDDGGTGPSARSNRWRRPGVALATFVVLVVGAHGLLELAGALLRPEVEPGSRHALFRRGWPALVLSAPERMSDTALDLVVISHSQGYGFEYEAAHTYPELLQRRLDRRGGEVVVHNWTAVGAGSEEFAILLAAAEWAGADAVVLVSGPRSFERWDRGGRTRFDSDVPQLLAWSEIRSRVRLSGMEFALRPRLEAYLARWSAAWRYREAPRSALLALRTRFEADRDARTLRFGTWFLRPGVAAPVREGRMRSIDLVRLRAVAELVRRLPRVVWIDMPQRSNRGAERDAFRPALTSLEDPPEVEEWSRRFDDDSFVTSVHLNEIGHEQMAEALERLLEERGILP